MKTTRVLGLVIAAIVVGWMFGNLRGVWRFSGDAASYHTGPTIDQVRTLSCLVTMRIDIADVQETCLDGYTGGARVAMLIKGDFLLGVDLSRAKFESVDNSTRTVVLALPQPQVTSPRLDHERTKVFRVAQTGLWQIAPGGGQTSGDVIDRGYRDAQRFVATACNDPALIGRSRQQAEQVLVAFFNAMGWKASIRWEP